MATTKNITMKQFNGTDYDMLYPKTDVKQIENLTPSSIGAVAKSGDTMTGNLSISKPISSLYLAVPDKEYRSEFIKNASSAVDLGTVISDVSSSSGGNYSKITICNATKEFSYQIVDSGKLTGNYHILHTGNAQTFGFTKIAIGSYVGTGTYGSANPNSLTFDFEPKIVFLSVDSSASAFSQTGFMFFVRKRSGSPAWYFYNSAYVGRTITWSGNTLSWYTLAGNLNDAPDRQQFNVSGQRYCYVALG